MTLIDGWPAELPPMRVLSLMSGTSLDGVDAVLARFEHRAGRLTWSVQARFEAAFDADLRRRLLRAIEPGGADVVALTQLHAEVGVAYADLCATAATHQPFDLVALSGQTVYHIPRVDTQRGWRAVSTLQVGEPTRVLEACGVPVVSDFRQSDLAAGGQGAPLVSFGDLHLFGVRGRDRAIHNLGGIGNVTWLPADGDPGRVLAFDTGPANCLLDEAVAATTGDPYDRDGALAAAGRVDEALLRRLCAHPYFRWPPPKTTGREEFNLRAAFPDGISAWSPADLLATLTAFTAETTAAAYRRWILPRGLDELLLAGGGALNATLVAGLRQRLPGVAIRTFEEVGWRSKDREALAFALMGYAAWFGLPNTLPSATGARHAVVAGRIARPPGFLVSAASEPGARW